MKREDAKYYNILFIHFSLSSIKLFLKEIDNIFNKQTNINETNMNMQVENNYKHKLSTQDDIYNFSSQSIQILTIILKTGGGTILNSVIRFLKSKVTLYTKVSHVDNENYYCVKIHKFVKTQVSLDDYVDKLSEHIANKIGDIQI